MPTTRRRALGTALLAITLVTALGCGDDAATGPTPPVPEPDPDLIAPTVSLASPAPDAELQGWVDLRAGARDNVGVAGVQFFVDDQPYGTEFKLPPYNIAFDSRKVADGSHTFSVRARDAAGHTTMSQPVTMAVYNQPGIVQVTVEGPAGWSDADGFQLHVGDSRTVDVAGTGTFTVTDVSAGTRRLVLGGLPPFCGADEQIVKVRSTAPASAVLTIGCLAEAANGWLLVARGYGLGQRLSALSLRTGRETVLVPQIVGLGAVSPDGNRLAFVDDGTLMVGDLDAFAPVAVAAVPGSWEVSWSPDGSAVVVASERGGLSDLFTVNADGTNLRPVFDAPGWRRRPAWSASGRIAFEVVRGGLMGDETSIWSADPDGGNLAQLSPGIYDESPAWSPDGTRLAFSRWVFTPTNEVQVAIVNASGSGAERIAGSESLGFPIWSPDGEWIVHSSPGALRATPVSGTPIMVVNDDGGQTLAWVAGDRFD